MGAIRDSFKYLFKKFDRFIGWLGSIGNSPGDSEELKSHKAIIVISHMAGILNLTYFSDVYEKMGRHAAALTLITFAAYLTLDLILFRLHRNFNILRAGAFIGMYVYIIVYHTVMGGYIGSTAYIFYGIPMLSGVQILYKSKRSKNVWFLVYLFTAIALFYLEPMIAQGMVPVADSFVLITYLNNFILISGLVVLSINYFARIILQEKMKSDGTVERTL